MTIAPSAVPLIGQYTTTFARLHMPAPSWRSIRQRARRDEDAELQRPPGALYLHHHGARLPRWLAVLLAALPSRQTTAAARDVERRAARVDGARDHAEHSDAA